MYFNKSGSFYKSKIQIAVKVNKAFFALLRKNIVLALPFDLQIELHESTICTEAKCRDLEIVML
jgi:hypothetical protein